MARRRGQRRNRNHPNQFLWAAEHWGDLLRHTSMGDWTYDEIANIHIAVLESRLDRMNIAQKHYNPQGDDVCCIVVKTLGGNEVELIISWNSDKSRWVVEIEKMGRFTFTTTQTHALDMLLLPWQRGNDFETGDATASLTGDGHGPGGTGFIRARDTKLPIVDRARRNVVMRSRSRSR